jgi:adenosylcobyric acid synthase
MKKGRHGGDLEYYSSMGGMRTEEILDFSVNINPLGTPEWFGDVVNSALKSVLHYPDPRYTKLISAIAARCNVDGDQVIVGNGSTEILYLLPRALNPRRALIAVPSYVDYKVSAMAGGLEIQPFPLEENDSFVLDPSRLESALQGDELVYLCLPNNPTGLLFDTDVLREVVARNPSTLFMVDEAFGDFVEGMPTFTKDRPPNVIVLLSLTKNFAIPGLRLGCGIGERQLVARIKKIQPPWTVNVIAQAVGEAALQDRGWTERSRAYVKKQREGLVSNLRSIASLTVYPAEANFLLVRIDRQDIDAEILWRRMLRRNVAIRVCSNFDGLDHRFFRIAVRTGQENRRLLESLQEAMEEHS